MIAQINKDAKSWKMISWATKQHNHSLWQHDKVTDKVIRCKDHYVSRKASMPVKHSLLAVALLSLLAVASMPIKHSLLAVALLDITKQVHDENLVTSFSDLSKKQILHNIRSKNIRGNKNKACPPWPLENNQINMFDLKLTCLILRVNYSLFHHLTSTSRLYLLLKDELDWKSWSVTKHPQCSIYYPSINYVFSFYPIGNTMK